MNRNVEVLIKLIRIALEDESEGASLLGCDWESVFELSVAQSVTALSLDGLLRLTNIDIDENLKYKWMGYGLVLEKKYKNYHDVAKELAKMWEMSQLNTYVLKGLSIAQFYPKPETRECVDLDVFLRATNDNTSKDYAWELGNTIVEDCGIEVSRDDYRHSIFTFKGVKVENHRICASSVKGKSRSMNLDYYMTKLIDDQFKSTSCYLTGSILRTPALFDVLFFMQHAYSHFMNEKLTMRHICDWGVLVNAYRSNGNVFWEQFHRVSTDYGFGVFAETMSRLIYKVCGIRAPWLEGEIMLEKQDELLLEDCFKKNVIKIPYESHLSTYIQLGLNRLLNIWKYKYFSDTPFFKDLFQSIWGVLTERNKK